MDWKSGRLKIHRAQVDDSAVLSSETGSQIEIDGYPAVITGAGSLVLMEVQPAGKKTMTGEVFLRGARDWVS
jgi:methionyl-tRNA formyltransferase